MTIAFNSALLLFEIVNQEVCMWTLLEFMSEFRMCNGRSGVWQAPGQLGIYSRLFISFC